MLADKSGVLGLDCLNEITDETQLLSGFISELRPLQEQLKTKNPIYFFGAKRNVSKMIRYCNERNIEVSGLIDNDPKKQGTKFEEYSVVSLESVNQDHLIVNSSGRFAIEVSEQMRNAGYRNFWNMA